MGCVGVDERKWEEVQDREIICSWWTALSVDESAGGSAVNFVSH